jgi:hypothetical protein
MRPNAWLIFLVASVSFGFGSCSTAPQVSPCVLDPAKGVGYCTSVKDGHTYRTQISDMTGYTAFTPDDTQTLTEWIKRHLK